MTVMTVSSHLRDFTAFTRLWPSALSPNGSAKPDARRQARVPKAKARSAAAGFACYALASARPRLLAESIHTQQSLLPASADVSSGLRTWHGTIDLCH